VSDPVQNYLKGIRRKPSTNGKQQGPAPAVQAHGSSDTSPDPARWEQPIPLAETAEAGPFPLDVLPLTLARFAEDVALAKTCPPDYIAVPLLAVAGAAIGASRALEIKQGWRERPCLYAAVIGPPGSAKTPALKAVAAPVYAEQTRRLANYRRQKVAWDESARKPRHQNSNRSLSATSPLKSWRALCGTTRAAWR
jgi:hypothetical protein